MFLFLWPILILIFFSIVLMTSAYSFSTYFEGIGNHLLVIRAKTLCKKTNFVCKERSTQSVLGTPSAVRHRASLATRDPGQHIRADQGRDQRNSSSGSPRRKKKFPRGVSPNCGCRMRAAGLPDMQGMPSLSLAEDLSSPAHRHYHHHLHRRLCLPDRLKLTDEHHHAATSIHLLTHLARKSSRSSTSSSQKNRYNVDSHHHRPFNFLQSSHILLHRDSFLPSSLPPSPSLSVRTFVLQDPSHSDSEILG